MVDSKLWILLTEAYYLSPWQPGISSVPRIPQGLEEIVWEVDRICRKFPQYWVHCSSEIIHTAEDPQSPLHGLFNGGSIFTQPYNDAGYLRARIHAILGYPKW